MESFPSNSKKTKEPKKKIEKVVTAEVVTRKKSLGARFKSVFIGGEAKTAVAYIGYEVLLPALKNMIVDATSKGIERVIYGDAPSRRQPHNGPRVQYNSPVNRFPGPRSSPFQSRHQSGRSYGTRNYEVLELIFATQEEANNVLDMMVNIIDTYDVASVSDLHELAGMQSSHIDNKWGWSNLAGVNVQQTRDGYIIDFPPVESV